MKDNTITLGQILRMKYVHITQDNVDEVKFTQIIID